MHHVPQSYAVIERAMCSQLLCVDGNIDKALELKTRTAQLIPCALKDMQCVDEEPMTKRRRSQAMSVTFKEQDGEVKTSTIVCS
jgi:hypothetical protein